MTIMPAPTTRANEEQWRLNRHYPKAKACDRNRSDLSAIIWVIRTYNSSLYTSTQHYVSKRTYLGSRRWIGKTRRQYFVQPTGPERLCSQNSMASSMWIAPCITRTSPVVTWQKDSPYYSGITQTFLGLSTKY